LDYLRKPVSTEGFDDDDVLCEVREASLLWV
jgi:hypothetical protein